MSFRLALSGLNAAQTDLNVTANNIANTATDRLQGLARGVRRAVRGLPAGRQQQRDRQRRARLERRAAVHAGQHRLHRQQPGSRDQRPGLLRPERRRCARRTRAPARSRSTTQGYVVNSQTAAPAGVSARRPTASFNTGALSRLQLVTSESAPAATTAGRRRVQPAGECHAADDRAVRSGERQQLQQRDVADDLRLARRRAHRDAVLRRRRRTRTSGRRSSTSTAMQSARRRRCSTRTPAR